DYYCSLYMGSGLSVF
nr:immunoglobulin light chain junction region [Macaca mulatta]MOY05033.1 immunoglobulin light chain junction region [Macaca mulatta]MOY05342.1 immunoglobulin light chain junction region [Macaca mulatta]MOY05352.1 immunoglobulin light chain junction region [Macaca mulatta]MOY05537.1 immunoglobulin light chain junction region [Macaca mulatta]